MILDHTATPKPAWLTVPPPAVLPISVLVQLFRKHTCDSALVQALGKAAVGEQGFPKLLLSSMQLLQRAHLYVQHSRRHPANAIENETGSACSSSCSPACSFCSAHTCACRQQLSLQECSGIRMRLLQRLQLGRTAACCVCVSLGRRPHVIQGGNESACTIVCRCHLVKQRSAQAEARGSRGDAVVRQRGQRQVLQQQLVRRQQRVLPRRIRHRRVLLCVVCTSDCICRYLVIQNSCERAASIDHPTVCMQDYSTRRDFELWHAKLHLTMLPPALLARVRKQRSQMPCHVTGVARSANNSKQLPTPLPQAASGSLHVCTITQTCLGHHIPQPRRVGLGSVLVGAQRRRDAAQQVHRHLPHTL